MIKRSLFQVHSPTTLILKYTYLILHLKYLLNIELINILKMHDHSNIPQFKHLLITDVKCTNYFYNKHIFLLFKKILAEASRLNLNARVMSHIQDLV